ncbi:MAG: hypothetical protein LBB94_05490 [Clostridiales bacterium]|jgi:hypothetical protein|nr:hypothetical protein [Clostridiales bacterium]
MKNIHRAIAVLTCVIPFILYPVGVMAGEEYDPNRAGSIQSSVVDARTGDPIDHDADVMLYMIAAPDTSKGFLNVNLIGDFASADINLMDISPESEATIVKTCLAVISEKRTNPDFSGASQNGTVHFGDLRQGLYLVVYSGSGKTAEGGLIVSPYLLSVPMPSVDEDGWLYDVVSYPKYIVQPTPAPTDIAAPEPMVTVTPRPDATSIPNPTEAPRPVSTSRPGSGPASPPDAVVQPDVDDAETNAPAGVPLITGALIQPPIYNIEQSANTPETVITQTPDPDIAIEPAAPPFGAPDLPQTGLNRLPVVIMSVLGCVLLLLGLIDSSGKRDLKQ